MLVYGDWINIDMDSDEYWEIEERYIDAFDEGIPLSEFPKDITLEELAKEVNTSIEDGVDIFTKRNPNFKPKDINDPDFLVY